MGIIILPFIFGAICISIMAIAQTIVKLRKKEIGLKEVLYGSLISFGIFGLICLSYLIQGKAWVNSPAFRIPLYLVYIPSLCFTPLVDGKLKNLKYAFTLIVISIAVSGILGAVFYDFLFGIMDILGIQKTQ